MAAIRGAARAAGRPVAHRLSRGAWADTASGLTFMVARPEHGPLALDLIAQNFVKEPMGVALGLGPADWRTFGGYFIPSSCSNGLSVIAFDDADNAVGIVLSRDFKLPLPPGFPEGVPKFEPIIDALTKLDTLYEQDRPGLRPGDVLDFWMGTVKPEVSKKGLLTTMLGLNLELARSNGYRSCVGECTGHYAQNSVKKHGFKELHHIVYADYRYKGKAVFASVPKPNVSFGIYERQL